MSRRAVEGVGRRVIAFVEEVGRIATASVELPLSLCRRPFRGRLVLEQLEAVGVGSLFIVTLTGFFVGAVLALQGLRAFGLFKAEALIGASVELSLARELAPVFAALMLTARTGSAMATELGTMRVTEQIDALETMAVNARQYLLAPRVVAGAVMLPLLTLLFNATALFGAWLVAVPGAGLSGAEFQGRIPTFTDVGDVLHGLVKAAVFGYVICLIAVERGYRAEGGAAGVGVATTRAVVGGSISILAIDYAMTALWQALGG
jgi:phospholipid/cholesterol/gamma-HCH transport system permease protein